MSAFQQLAFPLALPKEHSFANFYPAQNLELLHALQTMASGRGEYFIYFWGEAFSGRTHLLQAASLQAHHLGLSVFYLSLKNISELRPEVFEGLEKFNLVCIDDLDQIAGRPLFEEAFFHCYNRIQAAHHRLMVAALSPPAEIGLALPDLISRLSWGGVYHINALTDIEKLQALEKRAMTKGLTLPLATAQYLLHRYPRDLRSLFEALDRLDQASLEAKRRLTIPFTKAILAIDK